MKNRILALIFALLLILTVFCGCKKVENNPAGAVNVPNSEKPVDAKVQVIADSINIWKFDKTAYEGTQALYDYCVTDLDQNGQFELITVVNVPKVGVVNAYDTVVKYYELNKDFSALLTLERVADSESQPQPDLCTIVENVNAKDTDTCACFKDEETGRYYYVFADKSVDFNEDGTKSEHYSKVAISIFEGKAYEETLATYSILREKGKDALEVYTDGEGNEITLEEFEGIEDTRFEGLKKMKVTFGWQGCSESNFDKELNPASNIFIKKLSDSFYDFKINE
ncbi:MAG: hypothetical protein E7566_04130 [Ruminococcaceae bacterium]|nr:hypothetical protein [Oscillospiraceae bacterium]